MNTARPIRRRVLALAATGAVAAVALALAGCSTDAGVGSSAASAAAADSELAATVAKLQEPLTTYPVPTQKVTGDVASLKGKTVYYIPITFQAPAFGVTATALTTALDKVGVNVQRCDGKGQPTEIGACVTQATQAGAVGIVTDAIDYALAANAFDAAQGAGIPVIMSNHIQDKAHPDSATLVTIGDGIAMQVGLSQWFALDSGGKGNLLINQITNSPSGPVYVQEGKKAIADDCADCKITINEISSATVSLIEPSTSAALLKDANIGYVEPQFEAYLQPTQAAVQQSGRINEIKGLTGAAGLGSLKALASGSFLYAAAAPHIAYQGWADADAIIRLALKEPVPQYEVPFRLFTRENVSSVALTEEAEASGEWFGPTTFIGDFAALWGVQ